MTKINLETIKNSDVRRHFDESNEKWYFSVVDIVAIVSGSTDPRNYWKVLKNRLKKGQNKLVTNCNQLKMRSNDGKMYLTDVADSSTMLEIIKIISSAAVSPFKLWFGQIESKTDLTENEIGGDTEMKLMIDGSENKNEIVIHAMIAGTKIEDLYIELEHKKLSIRGKVSRIGFITDENKIIEEISWGTFSRIISLPALVNIDEAQASLGYGLLKIILPKINLSRVKEIKANLIS